MIVLALLACFFHHNADAFRPQKPFKADISFSLALTGAVNGTASEYIQLQAAADGMPMLSLKADPEGKLLVSFYKEGKKTDWQFVTIVAIGTLFDLLQTVRSAGRSFVCRRIDRIEIIDIK